MHLVLCHAADVATFETYRALHARAPEGVACVSVEALCAGLAWDFRLGTDATASRVRLPDGRTLDADEIESVLNRVSVVAPVGIEHAEEEEATYAREEFHAFMLGWLAALRNVVNKPTPQGLAGRHRTPLEWTWRAARAGLPVLPRLEATPGAAPVYPGAAASTVRSWAYVVGDEVLVQQVFGEGDAGPLGDDQAAACRELARAVDVDLLGIGFTHAPGGPAFVTATPTPPLPAGDRDVVDALAGLLGIGRTA